MQSTNNTRAEELRKLRRDKKRSTLKNINIAKDMLEFKKTQIADLRKKWYQNDIKLNNT